MVSFGRGSGVRPPKGGLGNSQVIRHQSRCRPSKESKNARESNNMRQLRTDAGSGRGPLRHPDGGGAGVRHLSELRDEQESVGGLGRRSGERGSDARGASQKRGAVGGAGVREVGRGPAGVQCSGGSAASAAAPISAQHEPGPDGAPVETRGSSAAKRATLAWGLKLHQRKRVGLCRTVRTAPTVQLCSRVKPDGSGRLVIRGIATCGSVHSCPQCAAVILSKRADELKTALDNHEREKVAIATFTLRHHHGIPLRVLRTLLGRAYSEMWAGKTGQRLKARLRMVGHVRAAEQTYGKNGWHPHLHCLLFFDKPPGQDWVKLLSDRWKQVVEQIHGRIERALSMGLREYDWHAERWRPTTDDELNAQREKLARLLGAKNARKEHLRSDVEAFAKGFARMGSLSSVLPDDEHGVQAEVISSKEKTAFYLAKMGCELSGILNKDAKPGHFTHWQLGQMAANGEEWAALLWREHAEAMMGARQLTWSRGLRELLGLMPERPDAEIAAEQTPEEAEIETPLGEIDGCAWDVMTRCYRQLFIAQLYESYEADAICENLSGPSRQARPPPLCPTSFSMGVRYNAARLSETIQLDDIKPSELVSLGQRRGTKPSSAQLLQMYAQARERGAIRMKRGAAEAKRRAERDELGPIDWANSREALEELQHYLALEIMGLAPKQA